MNLKRLVLIFLILGLRSLSGQTVTDDFSDGDFTKNPAWRGDSSHFIVNTVQQLQLHDNAAGRSSLSTAFPVPVLHNQEWRFLIRESFSPSGNNYGRVYLVADRENLNDTVNGYYLQFGEAGSNDAIQLFRQTGTTSVSVCRGNNGEIAAAFTLGVKVTRDSLGMWVLYADPTGGTTYKVEASGTDTLITSSTWFGVLAVYTASNSTRFYWDDFYAGPVYINHTIPTLSGLQVISDTKVDVQFSAPLDSATSSKSSNYTVNRGLGNPQVAVRDSSNPVLVHLQFLGSLVPDLLYELTISHLKNQAGDSLPIDSARFCRYIPEAFDIVINEIMANPKPAVNLPPYEYIELYNRKSVPVSLRNWTISIGSKAHLIGLVTIQPDSFVVLCSTTAVASFPQSLPVYAVSGFGALNNTGAELTLKTDSGRVMSCITYSDAWYKDAAKKKGGWSLEQIDPLNPCGGMDNWIASMNPHGGSPGKRNSVGASNPDHTSPELWRVGVISPDSICVYFNDGLDSTTVLNKMLYVIAPFISIQSVHPVGNGYTSVILGLGSPLQPGIIYNLALGQGIRDCSGNTMVPDAGERFGLADSCEPRDLVINELLPDPGKGGVKYVELYNRSSKILDLKDLNLSSVDSVTGLITDTKVISTSGYLVFPRDYLVLSTNGNTVKSQYRTPNPKGFADMPSMPRMNIGGGSLLLHTVSGTIIDSVTYSASWQFPLLSNTKGVALERIDPEKPSCDAGNWHSAAETAGFGTPAYKNSEYLSGQSNSNVKLDDPVFSPDEDGYNDVLLILYHFDKAGFLGNIEIYDSHGRLIRTLIRNVLLGAEGSFTWDGMGDDLRKAGVGIYIVSFRVMSLDGKQIDYKLCSVLASKL